VVFVRLIGRPRLTIAGRRKEGCWFGSTSQVARCSKALDPVAPLWRGAWQIMDKQSTFERAGDALTRAFSGADGI
jgi:hypothetical protein